MVPCDPVERMKQQEACYPRNAALHHQSLMRRPALRSNKCQGTGDRRRVTRAGARESACYCFWRRDGSAVSQCTNIRRVARCFPGNRGDCSAKSRTKAGQPRCRDHRPESPPGAGTRGQHGQGLRALGPVDPRRSPKSGNNPGHLCLPTVERRGRPKTGPAQCRRRQADASMDHGPVDRGSTGRGSDWLQATPRFVSRRDVGSGSRDVGDRFGHGMISQDLA